MTENDKKEPKPIELKPGSYSIKPPLFVRMFRYLASGKLIFTVEKRSKKD